jgi:hypothetical protein
MSLHMAGIWSQAVGFMSAFGSRREDVFTFNSPKRFLWILFFQCDLQIKENEVGGKCGTHGRGMFTGF